MLHNESTHLHTGVDFFAEATFSVEISSYYEDGMYELPEIFHIIDDNITEQTENFALISEPGPDSPPCFFLVHCHEQSVATQVIIIDNDCKLIFFKTMK